MKMSRQAIANPVIEALADKLGEEPPTRCPKVGRGLLATDAGASRPPVMSFQPFRHYRQHVPL